MVLSEISNSFSTAEMHGLATVRTAVSAFSGYDGATTSTQRRSASSVITSEDAVLPSRKRDQLDGNTRELVRNFSILGWMVRKHCDYVAPHHFRGRNDDAGLNKALEEFVDIFSRRGNCHAAGTLRLDRLTRMMEAGRTTGGDVGLLKLKSGHLQPIEGDLIRNPEKSDSSEIWRNGVRINGAGRPIQYSIWKRGTSGKGREFAKRVRASNMFMHGFYDRFDQTRGVSPIAAAIAPVQDVRENLQYALAKAKVSQLFTLIVKSAAVEGLGQTENVGTATEPKYKVKFGSAPQKLELEQGDDASILESNTPSTEFQSFMRHEIDLALKSLDIPYSVFDESWGTFHSSKAGWMHYDRSCHAKRADVQELLRGIILWRLSIAIASGEFQLPSGMTLRDLKFEHVPRGVPWWDPAKEIRGDLAAIGAGLTTPQRICRERDRGDFYENVDEIQKAIQYAGTKDVVLSFDPAAMNDVQTQEVEIVNQ
jgi:capsid protein